MPTFKRADQEQMEKAKDLLESSGPAAELGFVKSLFFGRLKLDSVMPYPKQDDGEARRTRDLIGRVQEFLKANVDPDKIDTEEKIPQDVISGLGNLGVLGMTVPQEFGGGGFSHTAYCKVLEKVSAHCASTAVLIGAHQSIGLKAILLLGTPEQKKTYLPALASGEKLAAFCLSEPEVGSDAANVQTRAVPSPDGSHFIINGEKKFATNAAIAGMMTVMARTPVMDKGEIKEKVTAFIVTPDLPGFEIVKQNRSKMGVRGSWQAVLKFTDMKVPADRVLGQVGKGLKVALGTLDYGRCTLSAGCVGGAKALLKKTIERARTRTQFARPIGSFGLIKQKIARMAETTFAMDAITYLITSLVDRHEPDIMLETTISKLFCSEGLWQISDDALQIWGGEGYMRENGIERAVRDARINRIVEGATEVMTAFIALVGMKGVGEGFESVLRSIKHPVGNFGRLSQFAREQWRDIVVGASFDGLPSELEAEGRLLAKLANSLAREVTKLLAKHREGILEMQLLQERVAWSVVDLYAMAAVISKLHLMLTGGNGTHDVKQDLIIGKGFCKHAGERISQRLHALHVNSDDTTMAVADAVLGPLES